MDTSSLEGIGLTKSEIAVYLALLKLGQTTAGPIVDEARVTRSKIYDILERLRQKGLVSSIMKQSTRYFSAANPQSILGYLEDKEALIRKERAAVQRILPELLLHQQMAMHKKIAEVFVGFKGMENAFGAMVNEFNANDAYYAFGAGKGENTEQIQRFFYRLHKQRIGKKVKSYILFNAASKGLFREQEHSPLVEARYLEQSTPAAINIYKDHVIIALLTAEPVAFLLKNKEAADSFREYFQVMWKIAKSY